MRQSLTAGLPATTSTRRVRIVEKPIVRAWIPANEMIVKDPKGSLAYLHKNHYANLSREDVDEMFNGARFYSTRQWGRISTRMARLPSG